MRAVTTPVATPRAKEPLKTPRKMPKDFNKAVASKLWLLSPAGWYATMELKGAEGNVYTEIETVSNNKHMTHRKTQTEIFKTNRASNL